MITVISIASVFFISNVKDYIFFEYFNYQYNYNRGVLIISDRSFSLTKQINTKILIHLQYQALHHVKHTFWIAKVKPCLQKKGIPALSQQYTTNNSY